jgi:hypothetical protein
MTVDELIKYLQGCKERGWGEFPVKVAVGSYYKTYPVSYLDIFSTGQAWDEVRLHVALDETFRVQRLKSKIEDK